MEIQTEFKVRRSNAMKLKKDAGKSAVTAHLVYVNDSQPGITRVRKGNAFQYYLNDKPVKDKKILDRIRKLVIPPAWERVWVCKSEDGHLQATGYDQLNRKQYRYHSQWNKFRNQTKFSSLYEFGKTLPEIRDSLKKHLSSKELSREKVLATIVSLMELTQIRIGNAFYEKAYGSYGLSTFKNQHVKIDGDHMRFVFKGKKGVAHNIHIKSKRLARIVKSCRDIPGKELFQYYDEDGNIHSVDSGEVNEYIKQISGNDFTSKDFRTWNGTLKCLIVFKEMGCCDTASETKKNVISALDMVAEELGNTRAVCKSHYVHPILIAHYENKELEKIFRTEVPPVDGLSNEESLLMKFLEKQ